MANENLDKSKTSGEQAGAALNGFVLATGSR